MSYGVASMSPPTGMFANRSHAVHTAAQSEDNPPNQFDDMFTADGSESEQEDVSEMESADAESLTDFIVNSDDDKDENWEETLDEEQSVAAGNVLRQGIRADEPVQNCVLERVRFLSQALFVCFPQRAFLIILTKYGQILPAEMDRLDHSLAPPVPVELSTRARIRRACSKFHTRCLISERAMSRLQNASQMLCDDGASGKRLYRCRTNSVKNC
jgi:hypothetical protein